MQQMQRLQHLLEPVYQLNAQTNYHTHIQYTQQPSRKYRQAY